MRSLAVRAELAGVGWWDRSITITVVLLVALAGAALIDRRIARRLVAPETVTRYRVLRRSVAAGIVAIGVLSALLVIPQVRAVAGGLLASSAILGLVVGFASRSTLANFVAGVLIAFTQPLRLGDTVEIGGSEGVVEEIGLTYTFIRTPDGARLVIPNERLASDTIRNSTIVSREKLAEITVQVPAKTDLEAVVQRLRAALSARPDSQVLVSALAEQATLTLRAPARDELAVEELASELRLLAHKELSSAGVYT